MLCLSLRQHYLGQVHWVSRLCEISGVIATPRRLIFQSGRLYFNIKHLARAQCRIRFTARAYVTKFNDEGCKHMTSENIPRAKNKKPCKAGFFVEYWLQQIN
jgi:hypothetical protein